MKKVTGIAILTTAEGERITYTYSVIDESTGTVTQNNIKRSFIILDEETVGIVESLKAKVNENLDLTSSTANYPKG